MTATRHTRLICHTESLARAIFTDILPTGDGCIGKIVSLQKEFQTLVRVEATRYGALKTDLDNWRKQVSCGEVDFDPAREDDFKGALRALITLEAFLIEKFDAYQKRELLLAKTRAVLAVQSRQQTAQNILDYWKSPEWETADERTVKWDKEQTRYLREKLGVCE